MERVRQANRHWNKIVYKCFAFEGMRKMKSSAYCLIVIAACAMSNLSFAEDTTPVYWASSRLILFITLYILSNIPHRVYTLTFPPLPPGAGR